MELFDLPPDTGLRQVLRIQYSLKNARAFDSYSDYSKQKVLWECAKGHEWEAVFKNRFKGSGCPYCANKKVLAGFNDLLTVRPEIAAQWHPTRNGDLTVSAISVGIGRKVWWQCEKGHEWEMSPSSRTGTRKLNCPYCSNQKILHGYNDLQTTHPLIGEQWHPTKNKNLSPKELAAGSSKKVWWQCEEGHEWNTTVNSRTNKVKPTGCPYCSGLFAIESKTDIATINPELACQWHPTKNSAVTPNMVSAQSNKKIWWLCINEHQWLRSPAQRSRGEKCPYCSNREVLEGFNDLATVKPELAAQWHPTKNGEDLATHFTYGSGARIWWQCEKGHEWAAQISDRSFHETQCPRCSATSFASKGEKEIRSFLDTLNIKYLTNSREVIKNQEIDIFIPENNIAIEFNGIYWHSEKAGKTKTYHYDKWLQCQKQGIQLIQIWEDNWSQNPQIVKRMLMHKLHLSKQEKTSGRKTAVKVVSSSQAKIFMQENHIQGFASGSYYLGLEAKETKTLVALIILRKEKGNSLNIIRYATRDIVTGGFTKLIKYAETTYHPDQFFTFSDNMVSNGLLYANNEFKPELELKPDYMYVSGNKRQHKFNYRISSFRSNPNLQYQEGLTEKELAQLNGLFRVWDAGKTRWVKQLRRAL